jgi:5'-methylthioadenosine phosphorylase
MFRLWGADIVNSHCTEAILPRTGNTYVVVAMSTDYDSWKDEEDPVTWEEVLKVLMKMSLIFLHLLLKVIERL